MNNELQFLMYNTPDEDVSVNAVVKDDTIWLTQRAMAELFDCSSDNISLHIKNIYSEGELTELATAEDFSVVQNEGVRQVKRTDELFRRRTSAGAARQTSAAFSFLQPPAITIGR